MAALRGSLAVRASGRQRRPERGSRPTGALADGAAGFVEIPAGPFVMGGDPARRSAGLSTTSGGRRTPEGTVDVPAFFIARHEVTVAQFQASPTRPTFKVDARALAASRNHPVTFVSWPDALAYCRWLEATLKARPRHAAATAPTAARGWRVTLPSEAEWEKAARGTDGADIPVGQRAAPRPRELRGDGHDAGRQHSRVLNARIGCPT